MASITTVQLVDDTDGTEASETVNFGIDGVQYEIDLNDKNAAALREALDEWTKAARRAGGRKSRNSRPMPNRDLNQVRTWARENGYEVSDRGRIKAEIIEAYDKAVGR